MIWDYQLLIGGGVVNSNLSESSKYPLQTDVATKEINRLDEVVRELESLKATLSSYGMTKLSISSDVTDTNAYSLSATANNPNIDGSLANKISRVQTNIETLTMKSFSIPGQKQCRIICNQSFFAWLLFGNTSNAGAHCLYYISGYGDPGSERRSVNAIKPDIYDNLTIQLTGDTLLPNGHGEDILITNKRSNYCDIHILDMYGMECIEEIRML